MFTAQAERQSAEEKINKLFARFDADPSLAGWERSVDLLELNMENTRKCAIAYVYGDYETGCKALFKSREEAAAHGACLLDDVDSFHMDRVDAAYYETLTQVARAKILDRLAHAARERVYPEPVLELPAWIAWATGGYPLYY